MDRVAKALHSLKLDGRGLEVGPSYGPLVSKVSGARIETVDHAPQAELVAKYRELEVPQDLLDKIEPVDHLWSGGSLLEVIGERKAYDYIIASHFIEHTVDLIGFLADCEALLVDGGRLSLVIPDKRYCFDHFQPLTSVGDIIDAHHLGLRFHPAGAHVDHYVYSCTDKGSLVWSAHDDTKLEIRYAGLNSAAEPLRKGLAQQDYVDTHRWKFTPTSFDLIVTALRELDQHGFGVVESFPTAGFEFFVTLGSDIPARPEMDRLEVFQQIESELAEPVLADYVARHEHDALQRENERLRAELDEVYRSQSWRVTQPVRGISEFVRRLRT